MDIREDNSDTTTYSHNAKYIVPGDIFPGLFSGDILPEHESSGMLSDNLVFDHDVLVFAVSGMTGCGLWKCPFCSVTHNMPSLCRTYIFICLIAYTSRLPLYLMGLLSGYLHD